VSSVVERKMKYKSFIKISVISIICGSGISLYAQGFPKPVGYVNDFAGVMGSAYQQRIEQLASEIERKTSAEISVVTVQTVAPSDIEQYAVDLFEKWEIGKKGKDNGVLILLARQERKVRIEVGYGLEGVLPDGLCGQIIREKMTPFFKRGKFGEGLLSASATIASIIAREYGIEFSPSNVEVVKQYYAPSRARPSFLGLIIKFLLFLFLVSIFGWRILLFPLFFGGFGYWGGGRGGFGGGSFGGSFGGFGGGLSGGGGASGSW